MVLKATTWGVRRSARLCWGLPFIANYARARCQGEKARRDHQRPHGRSPPLTGRRFPRTNRTRIANGPLPHDIFMYVALACFYGSDIPVWSICKHGGVAPDGTRDHGIGKRHASQLGIAADRQLARKCQPLIRVSIEMDLKAMIRSIFCLVGSKFAARYTHPVPVPAASIIGRRFFLQADTGSAAACLFVAGKAISRTTRPSIRPCFRSLNTLLMSSRGARWMATLTL